MNDLRMRFAAIAVAIGLGALGGYAMGSNKGRPAATASPVKGTKVIRRTVHVRRHHSTAAGPPHPSAGAALASAPVAPVSTGSSGASSTGSSSAPIHTGSSGASGGGSSHPPVSTGSSGGAASGGDGGGEHERGD